MRKIVLVIAISVASLVYSSCGAESAYIMRTTAQTYVQTNEGRSYVGVASSESECYEKAKAKGCGNSYRYYPSDGNCYCK
jgi:hypothetical protein